MREMNVRFAHSSFFSLFFFFALSLCLSLSLSASLPSLSLGRTFFRRHRNNEEQATARKPERERRNVPRQFPSIIIFSVARAGSVSTLARSLAHLLTHLTEHFDEAVRVYVCQWLCVCVFHAYGVIILLRFYHFLLFYIVVVVMVVVLSKPLLHFPPPPFNECWLLLFGRMRTIVVVYM